MKQTILILTVLLFLCPALQAKLPVWLEGAALLTLDDPNQLSIEGSCLIDLSSRLQLRAELINLDLLHEVTLQLGTRLGFDALLQFPSRSKYALYGVGGFILFTMKDYTRFCIEAGLGAQLNSRNRIRPFLEALVQIYTATSNGFSNDNVALLIRGGVRFR